MEIFRAYDIRGEYQKDIYDEDVYKIARVLGRTFKAKKAVIGRDTSLASPNIYQVFKKGLVDQGVLVTDIGIAGTDVVYFAAGHFKFDLGIEITASHSAGHLSGIKIIGPNASPFGKGFGMEELKENVLSYQEIKPEHKGNLVKKDIWQDFTNQVITFTGLQGTRRLKVVVDASNAVGSLEIDNLEKYLPEVDIIKINWELDGNYPGHQPNPFLAGNRRQLADKVQEVKADFGVAFDGDADRIYFVDGKGELVFGSYINVLIAERMCRKEPNRVVLHDVRASRYIRRKIKEAGGIPKMELVGHAFFKGRMRKENALFGGEATGHIYYNFGDYMIENSLIAFVQILQIVSESNKSLRELTKEGRLKYPTTGEHNFSLPGFEITDDLTPEAIRLMHGILDKLKERYTNGDISDFDTLTVNYPDWNFNLRPSANDPVIRLTIEATSKKLLLEKHKEMVDFLEAQGCQYVDDTGVVQIPD